MFFSLSLFFLLLVPNFLLDSLQSFPLCGQLVQLRFLALFETTSRFLLLFLLLILFSQQFYFGGCYSCSASYLSRKLQPLGSDLQTVATLNSKHPGTNALRAKQQHHTRITDS